ncbi:hypothetical protein ABZ897_15675 [Nonomuraea sp. NPDC046802]|uniref:hypothetical protein n=1 Tax=Nonomuraea sp. NPDC046802 TaxID=3154919 RepID=UPI00340618A9
MLWVFDRWRAALLVDPGRKPMLNGKIADVVPITSADVARQDFGIYKAQDGSTIQVVHKADKVKLRVQSKIMHGDDVMDVVLYLDYDAETALPFQVAVGMAAIGAKGHLEIDAPEGMR